jgi:hypothetical protein
MALDWIYRSITTLVSLGPKAEFCDVSQGIITLRETLEIIGKRWPAAGGYILFALFLLLPSNPQRSNAKFLSLAVYLRLLETRQAVKMD